MVLVILMDKKLTIALVILVVCTALLIGLQGFLSVPEEKPEPEFSIGEYSNKTSSEKTAFNVKDYDFEVSSEKPSAAIAKFADSTESENKQGTELTIYNQNLALVKEIRFLNLKSGLNLVKYTDIAEQIKPDTVLFKDLEYPSTFVVEQNYEYDIVNKSKMLEKYLDKTITIKTKEGELFEGKLLSYSSAEGLDQLLMDTGERVVSLNEVQEIYFPQLSEGLITKPTLVWKLYSESDGNRSTQTTYLTKGMTWEADYIAKINQGDSELKFNGWVTIENTSGTAYPNTSLKLVAGDLHLAGEEKRYRTDVLYETAMGAAPKAEQFTEEALYEYHMYSLDRQTNIKDKETKQISLLSASNVPVTKKFVFDPERRGWYYYSGDSTERKKVKVMLEFKNSEDQGMGMPLPKGTVRVYKEDSQGKLQFVGEDRIDHTPKDEELSLLTGYAFDIVGEKKTTKEERISDRCREYSYEVELRNHKDSAVTVYAVEHTSGDSELINSSHSHEQKDAYTYEFPVKVPADGEATLTYTIRTCW